jgi:putative YpdA family bacillithiol system oxidoreductase
MSDRGIHESVSQWLLALEGPQWLAIAIVAATLIVGVHTLRRWLEERRARATLEEATRLELHIPSSLHPVIDPDICIGSGSCLSACPEGKILGMVDGVATLVGASHCIGHGRCAAECPVSAIRLVFGSAERGVDLPEVDSFFETSRPGVHIVGELGGMGLIKNALTQGLQVAARLGQTLTRPCASGIKDLLIVGAGPAGIAAAVGARAAGLSFEVVEQDTLGGTVAQYPRQKLVMTEAVNLPFYGPFGRAQMSKEELVAAFADVAAAARIDVHQQTKVTAIDGQLDDFVISTTRGVVRARRVVLATGLRGTPRMLGVPGQELPKVAYRLIDPEQYTGQRVLVVGGGDSALEAAIQLAENGAGEVSIAYRRAEFGRCRPQNKQKLDALCAAGRIRALMSTEIAEVLPHAVAVDAGPQGQKARIPNDYVIACLGGELPTEFLKSVGVGIRRHHGDRAMPNPALGVRVETPEQQRSRAMTLAILGAGVLFLLAVVGKGYYLLPQAKRYLASDHVLLRPAGAWGHGVGLLATAFMFLNFVYSARKRLRRFKRRGPIGPWLRFHVFVGLMSPAVILFHSAFQWGNHLATATYLSLVVVVVAGLIGRFIYGFHRVDGGDAHRVGELRASFRAVLERLPGGLGSDLTGALATGAIRDPKSLAALLLMMPGQAIGLRWCLARRRSAFLDGADYREFRGQALRLRRLEVKLRFEAAWKRLMRIWRVLHVTLAIMLVGLIGIHIWVSVRVGLKWFWS